MGAPVGNCNAAKNKSACRANKGTNGKSPHANYGKGWYSKNRGYRKSMLGNRLRSKRFTYETMGKKSSGWGYTFNRDGRKVRVYIPER